MGLMQLMPATAARFRVDRPYDPAQNIAAGVAYLRELLDRYSNDEALALAAYNAGPGAVERYGLRVPPYRETRDYVARIRNRTNGLEARAARRNNPVIYRTVDVVDGREVPRYTNVRPPKDSTFEVVGPSR
jgi:soluble lytic murein transglycosylase-like protein